MNSRGNNNNYQESSAAEEPALPSVLRRIAIADNQIDSRELFAGTREIIIAHGADSYRLRVTSQNKLILTK
jgi:hemin uptake protein HemP